MVKQAQIKSHLFWLCLLGFVWFFSYFYIIQALANTSVLAEEIELSYEKDVIKIGEVLYVVGTVYPEETSNQSVQWESSDKNVAEILENGEILGLAAGTVEITCTTLDGSDIQESFSLTVGYNPEDTVLICREEELELEKGKTKQLVCDLWPEQPLSYSSDNPKVAIVSETGEITVCGKGLAKITVTAEDGATASCMVTGIILPKKLMINQTNLVLKRNKNVTLKVIIGPKNISKLYQKLTWSSNNKKVAVVDQDGKVTAKGYGTCTIQAKSINGIKVSCKIVVTRD